MNENTDILLAKIEDLQQRLAEAEQHIEAIRSGEVDAFAISVNDKPVVFTLESGDYAYRVLVENFSEGALNLSDEGMIVYTNAYFHKLLGLPYEKVIGRSVIDFIHPSSLTLFKELFTKGKEDESKGEINMIAGDQVISVYISLTSLAPMMQTVGMIVTDLSEKKMQEKLLRQQNEELEHNRNFITNVLESSNHGVLSYTAIRKDNVVTDFEISYANPPALEQLNLPAEQVIGNLYLTVIPQAKEVGAWQRVCRVLETGMREKHIVNSIYFPDRLFEVIYTPLEDGVTCVFTEITEQKKREKELETINAQLRESEEKFSRLFESSPFSISLSEAPSGIFTDVNDNFSLLTGYSREEVLGKNSLDLNLIRKTSRERIMAQLGKTGSVKNVEVELRNKKGELIPILVSIETIQIGDKQYFLNALNDISGLKRSEREIERKNKDLEKMNKELQSFAYISSHDLQEPLRKIQTFGGRILEMKDQQLSEKGKEYFMKMQQAAQRMQRLIHDLLAYSRTTTEAGKPEKSDLSKILDEVKDEMAEEILNRNADITTSGLGESYIIPFQFRQLLQNLIGNSLKFSLNDHAPQIRIESETRTGSELENDKLNAGQTYQHISVTDDCIGFDPQYSEKIFDVFQRLHGQSEYAGTGVGLSIVKKIVENHKGFISASSEKGKGARFDIFIPVA